MFYSGKHYILTASFRVDRPLSSLQLCTMSFLVLMGFLFTLIIGVKLTLLLINLLQSNYGRKMGFGVKWTSDKNEYVLIAGATGLVGREFVREFASMGFNLILVSKNKDKLTALEQDYKEKYHLKEVGLVGCTAFHLCSLALACSITGQAGTHRLWQARIGGHCAQLTDRCVHSGRSGQLYGSFLCTQQVHRVSEWLQ